MTSFFDQPAFVDDEDPVHARANGESVSRDQAGPALEPTRQTVKDLVLGVNVDSDRTAAVAFLRKNRLPWVNLYEPGGLESRLATELGVLTLPTMLLIDEKGKVINRNIHVSELETELKKRLK